MQIRMAVHSLDINVPENTQGDICPEFPHRDTHVSRRDIRMQGEIALRWPTTPNSQGQYTVLLGIRHYMGRDLDVGQYRLRSALQGQYIQDYRRDDKRITHLDDRWIIQQEEGSRLLQGGLDYFLQEYRPGNNSSFLGKVLHSQFIPSRNAWPLHSTPLSSRSFRVL
jgi:hypothetical protein